jgi:hypothetical protein
MHSWRGFPGAMASQSSLRAKAQEARCKAPALEPVIAPAKAKSRQSNRFRYGAVTCDSPRSQRRAGYPCYHAGPLVQFMARRSAPRDSAWRMRTSGAGLDAIAGITWGLPGNPQRPHRRPGLETWKRADEGYERLARRAMLGTATIATLTRITVASTITASSIHRNNVTNLPQREANTCSRRPSPSRPSTKSIRLTDWPARIELDCIPSRTAFIETDVRRAPDG